MIERTFQSKGGSSGLCGNNVKDVQCQPTGMTHPAHLRKSSALCRTGGKNPVLEAGLHAATFPSERDITSDPVGESL